MTAITKAIENIYEMLEGEEDVREYHRRHGVKSLLILTCWEHKRAIRSAMFWEKAIKNKVVVEIGAGVGLVAIEMATVAKHVYAIEADPSWSWVFTKYLYRNKPPNLTWIFGRAEDMVGKITGDVSIIFTHSDLEGMKSLGDKFSPETILAYHSWQAKKKYG